MQKNKVLAIAYHFPPILLSSGIQRTLKFATYLRDHGWESIVLTVNPRAYEKTNSGQLGEIPDGMVVERAFALDSARHLAIAGRYPRWFAIPDRYSSWVLGGLWSGLTQIRRNRPDAIWSTYPIATAHLLGALLHRLTGLPWIADFRDSMTEDDYPQDAFVRRIYQRIERYAVHHADRCVFTTQGTRAMYAARYPDVPPEHWVVIPNGFDEDNFVAAQALLRPRTSPTQALRLLHSGILYPSERDPSNLFEAISQLKAEGALNAHDVRIILRATANDDVYRPTLERLGINDIVELQPGVPYRDALKEMLEADGLLLLQASNCNHQVPAKLYEYLRARRPILALTDPIGDTATELRAAGVGTIVPLDNTEAIRTELKAFLARIRDGSEHGASATTASAFDRRAGAAHLADLLNDALNKHD